VIMPPQFLAWQFWGVISPHLPNKRHMGMLPPRTGRTIPTGSCCRATGIYIHNCVPIRANGIRSRCGKSTGRAASSGLFDAQAGRAVARSHSLHSKG
jgi:hypothetical protein